VDTLSEERFYTYHTTEHTDSPIAV